MNRKNIILCFILLAISSCGPVYRTQYNYTSPNSWEGRQCANQCIKDKSNCRQQCNKDVQTCQSIESIKEAANIAIRQNTNKAKKDPYDNFSVYPNQGLSKNDCSNHSCYNGCDSDYNACFVNCGGEVKTETICVSNCDKKGNSDFLF